VDSDGDKTFWDDLFRDLLRPAEVVTPNPYQPRDLTDDDRAGWDAALSAQPRGKQATIDDVKQLIRHRNPIKWWQMQRDFKWLQGEMKRLGLNPEDARFLL
jgi:hypothetical protein